MRNEYLKLKKQREIDNSFKFQRKVLMAAVTGLEFLNNKFDPFSIKLDGWSESVNENIFDYDEIFEELYAKYGGGGRDVPTRTSINLCFGWIGLYVLHLQNTMFKSSLPGMDDILKQNPDLMKQFESAAVGSMGQSGGAPPGMMGMMRGMGMAPQRTWRGTWRGAVGRRTSGRGHPQRRLHPKDPIWMDRTD